MPRISFIIKYQCKIIIKEQLNEKTANTDAYLKMTN